jgi:hypothetical protein
LAGRLINDLLDNQSAIDLLEYFEQDPNSRDIKDSENKELTSSIFFGEESPKSKLIKALTGSTAAQRLDKIIPELKKLADDAAQKKQEAEEKLTTIQKERKEKINNTLPELSVLTERLERLKEEAKATATNLKQLTNQLEDAKISVAACDDEAINLIRLITKLEEGATEEQIPGQKLELDKKIDLLRKLKRDVNYLETSKQQLEQQAEEKTQEANEAEKRLGDAQAEDELELQELQKASDEFAMLELLAEAAAKRLERAKLEVNRLERAESEVNGPDFSYGDGINLRTLTEEVEGCNTDFSNISPLRPTLDNSGGRTTIRLSNNIGPLGQSSVDEGIEEAYKTSAQLFALDRNYFNSESSRDYAEEAESESKSLEEDKGSLRSRSNSALEEANLLPNTSPSPTNTDSLKSQSKTSDSQQSIV